MGKEAPIAKGRTFTLRIFLISTILIFANAYWVLEVEGIWHTNHATAMSLFWNTVFCLLLLVLFNIFVLKRFAPRHAFSQGELATCFTMMTIGTALAGHDSLQLGIPAVMGFPIWFQSQQPTLGWDRFNHFYPEWAMVKDVEILKPLYYGHATAQLYTPKHLLAWAVPVLWWCGFIVALGTVLLCMSVLLRKAWMENEKLAYPVVQLPMAMTEDGGTLAFFRNKALWIGLLVGASLDIWNGLATFYPAIPIITVRHDAKNIGDYATSPPWNAVGWVPLPLYPFIVALGYFLPTDLSFSLWFFFLLKLVLRVVAASIGTPPSMLSQFPYFTEQSFGAWGVITLAAVWYARHHLREVWIKIISPGESSLDDSEEPIRYRTAALGILLGSAFLFFFCFRAGMSPWIIAAYFAFFFLLSIGIARLRAELGPPAHEMAGNLNGTGLLTLFLGTQGVGLQNLTMMTMFWWFCGRGYRSHLMPGMLEGMRMGRGSDGRGQLHGMGIAMILALFLGGLASFWAALHLQYGAGINAMTNHNWGQFSQIAAWGETPLPPDYWGQVGVVTGAIAALAMTWLRSQFLWFPFHPAGYAIALTFGGEYYWSCLIIAWVLKCMVLRYGGMKMDRRVQPFMFGLILGEYAIGAFWSFLSLFLNEGAVINVTTYDFAPG